jgi:hypothetical protein
MWIVGDVEPVRVMGAEGYPYAEAALILEIFLTMDISAAEPGASSVLCQTLLRVGIMKGSASPVMAALSGHARGVGRCPLIGVKRTHGGRFPNVRF